jgi:hypothetical protein
MSAIREQKVACWACRHIALQMIVTGVEPEGFPDLDLRPAEPARSTMGVMLKECMECGYVSYDLAREEAGALDVLRSDTYGVLRKDGSLASRFLRRAMIEERLGQKAEAAASTLCAAWDADDANDRAAAVAWRSRAANLFKEVLAEGVADPDQRGGMRARIVDTLRRSGRFKEAMAQAERFLANPECVGIEREVIAFGRLRAEASDALRYTVVDASPSAAN